MCLFERHLSLCLVDTHTIPHHLAKATNLYETSLDESSHGESLLKVGLRMTQNDENRQQWNMFLHVSTVAFQATTLESEIWQVD